MKIALKRLFRCWAVNRSGDGFNVEPADLLQEYSIVNTTKHYANRDTTATSSMTSRAKVASMIICKQDKKKFLQEEKHRENGENTFAQIGPSDNKTCLKETLMYHTNVSCWLMNLDDIKTEMSNTPESFLHTYPYQS